MKMSKILGGGLLAIGMSLAVGSAQAQSGAAFGCWSSGQSPQASVCFGDSGSGLFVLIWNSGRCGGNAYVNSSRGNRVTWEVPRQPDACVQDGEPTRLALREYSCRVSGQSMSCRETIYMDDGSIWKEKENVVFDVK